MSEAPANVAPARTTILVVDDDRELCEMLRGYLGRDYDVTVACDGEEALRLARERRPDLVLLDVMMPRLSGFSVAWVFRNDPRYRGVPVIFMTAHAAADIERKLSRADGHLLKPFSLDRLVETVTRHLPEALRDLGLAPVVADAPDDRRLCPRRTVRLPAKLQLPGRTDLALVRSVSLTGAYVQCTEPLVAGTMVVLAFDHGGATFRGDAEVLYAAMREGQPGVGIHFRPLTPQAEQVLDQVVTEASADGGAGSR